MEYFQDFPEQQASELPVIETSSNPSEKRIDETKSQHKHPIPSGKTSRSVKQTHTMYNIVEDKEDENNEEKKENKNVKINFGI